MYEHGNEQKCSLASWQDSGICCGVEVSIMLTRKMDKRFWIHCGVEQRSVAWGFVDLKEDWGVLLPICYFRHGIVILKTSLFEKWRFWKYILETYYFKLTNNEDALQIQSLILNRHFSLLIVLWSLEFILIL